MQKSTKKSREASELKVAKEKVIALCQDKKQAKDAVEELLALQRQEDFVPMEVAVSKQEVRARYSFGAFNLIRCKTCIIFKAAGFFLVSKPLYTVNSDGGVLYGHLSTLCALKEKEKAGILDDTEKKILELMEMVTYPILSLPMFIFASDTATVEMATAALDKIKALGEAALSAPLAETTEEEEIKNDEFRLRTLMDEESKKEIPHE